MCSGMVTGAFLAAVRQTLARLMVADGWLMIGECLDIDNCNPSSAFLIDSLLSSRSHQTVACVRQS